MTDKRKKRTYPDSTSILPKLHTQSTDSKRKWLTKRLNQSCVPNRSWTFTLRKLPLKVISISSSHHHQLSLNCEGHWGTTDDFTTSFLHFSLFSTALWDSVNSGPVNSLMLSSHLFFCLPGLNQSKD